MTSRDFIGYGAHPPDFTWPNGARVAVDVVLNYEEGGERNILDGDAARETLLEAHYSVPDGDRELFAESTFEYGSRVGVWRVIDALDEVGVAPTIFATALALERNPAATEAFLARGCDIVGHGYRWIPHAHLSVAEQRRDIELAVTTIRRLTGKQINGWFTRPPNTVHTRSLLAAAGVTYDAGSISDDLPYYEDVDGKPFLIVPYSLDVNDTKFYKGQFFTGRDFADYAIDGLGAALAGRRPTVYSIGLHARIIGRPARLAGLRRVLDHLASRDDIWIAGRDDIASFWRDTFPPPEG
ncbi:polysaccharide deacetylase family protein [Nocardia jinanensis]|uniref:Chitin deacetylase n=1 Tax=Nocardia jinanensis TaxID=382504 RepID=A0A917R6H5_9NOCA|nr:polysaccharide deacetylase family protein [Nocardia jinanensis]GGK91639.1 chitin deacetylase [Nocardia jinanensis]